MKEVPFLIFDLSLIITGIMIIALLFRFVNKKGISEKFALQFGTKKFKGRTFVAVVSFSILVVLMGVLSISFIKAKIIKRDRIALEQTVESTRQKIDFWVEKRNTDIQQFVESDQFVSYLKNAESNDSIALPASLGFNYCFINKENIIFNPYSDQTIKVSSIGEQCQNNISTIFSGKELYLNNIDDSVESCFARNGDSKGILYKGIPVKKNDAVIGVILCEVFTEREMSELLRFSRVGESGESYLINGQGNMVTKSRFEAELAKLNYFKKNESGGLIIPIRVPSENIFESNSTVQTGQEELTFMAENLLKKNSGSNVDGYLDYRGVPVQGSWIWLDKYNLGLVTEIDKSESLSVFYFIRQSAFVVLFIVILIIVSSVLFSISLGEKANEVLIKAKDDLEHQVQDRTAELRVQTTALQAAANAIFITDPDGKMIWINQATTDLTGYSEEDCLGQNPRIFKSNHHPREFYEELWNTINSGKVWKGELINKRKNKEIYIEEMTITPIMDDKGQITNFVAVKQDISERKNNEKEIINERKRFAQLLDSTPDAIVIINNEGIIEVVNDQLLSIFKYERSEVIGQTIEIFLPNEYKEKHVNLRGTFFSNPSHRSMGGRSELFAKRKDNSVFPVEISLNPIKIEDETLVAAAIRDITERKNAEDEIKRSEEFRRLILNSTGEGIYGIDLNGNCTFANTACIELLGYDKQEELLGKNMHDLIHHTLPNGEPYIMQECQIYKAFKKGVKVHVSDEVFWKKDGTSFPVEYWSYPMFHDGEIIGSVLAFIDITERKALLTKIKQSEQQFRSIAQTAQDAIISADSKGIIMSWNPSAESIFGYSENEATGQDLSIIVPDQYKNRHKEGMERVKSGGEKHAIGKTVELIGLHKSGRTFPIELSLSNWTGPNGMEFSGIIRDISERKKFQEALEEANKRMSGELNVAKDIQMSMLPLIFPAFPKRKDINIHASLIPAREVGGDFYDFFFIDDSHLCFVVGDVSGKGVPAALMMAVCKTLIKSKAGNDKSTASILTQVNEEMARENSNYMFVTVFLGILNTATGELTYTNAGHNPTYIRRSNSSVEKLTELHGPVVAAMEGLSYTQSSVELIPGDYIFAYTDGIPEAHNTSEELFGNNRLDEFIKTNPFNSPQTVIDKIINSVHEFENGAPKFDDLTALCIEYHGDDLNTQKRQSFTITNNISEVQKIIQSFELFAQAESLPLDIGMKMSIVFDEILANVVNYAYEDEEEHEIHVEFKKSGNKLILTIEDDGIPFNPFSKNPPDTKLNVEERAIGGLGIHIVKNLMDECHYHRVTGRNIVTLIKYDL